MTLRLVLAAAVVPALAAGCGAGGTSPSVAGLGANATTTSSSTHGSPLAFARCMRAHGEPRYPDPSGHLGPTDAAVAAGIDPNSPTFRSARQACRRYLPNGGVASPQQIAQFRHSAVALAHCMRAHGVKDFPDPTFSNSGMRFDLNRAGLNPNDPLFQRAQTACQAFVPKGKGGTH